MPQRAVLQTGGGAGIVVVVLVVGAALGGACWVPACGAACSLVCLHCPIAHPLLHKQSHYLSGDNEPPAPTYVGGRMHPEEIAKPGFDPRGPVEFWDLTNRQDWALSDLAQEGIGSRGYVPGPYSNREELLHALDRFMLERTS